MSWRGVGIDIASWQQGIDPAAVDADFIIIKATEGVSYVNPFWRDWAERTLASGKRIGLYHYANGGDVYAEANHFLETVADFVGRSILVLDWESGGNERFSAHASWTKPWLLHVQQRTGATPLLYLSASIIGANQVGYPLWVAQYPDYTPTGYQENPWNEGAYKCAIRQYTSTGRIAGYSGNLDLNKAYISPAEWDEYAGGFDMASAQEIIDILKDRSDPTGRGKNLTDHDHIKWIAAGQAEQGERIARIEEAVNKIVGILSKEQ